MNKKILCVLVLVCLAYLLHLLLFLPQQPQQMATHFNSGGAADGWSSRYQFVLIQVLVMSFLMVLFLLIPVFLQRLPDHLVNLPHRDYWLAAGRRDQSLQTISDCLLKMGTATMLFMLLVNQMVFDANHAVPVELDGAFMYLLIVYLLYISWLSLALWLHFRRVPEETEA